MFSIQTSGLSHSYGSSENVLTNVDLNIPKQSIYGFLGPNGAGKTTTLKILIGLIQKQKGEVKLFDTDIATNRTHILKRIGTLIESPSIYAHLTARENLAILQKIHRCNKSNIQEVLSVVDLTHAANKKAGKFSLGMKQRLGIAMALLHEPELLILDEPTNGLDPNGMIEVRELLKRINTEKGVTVVISSHILAEIEKTVTHLGIIHKGNVLFEGTMHELQQQQNQKASTLIDTSNNTMAMQLLEGMQIIGALHKQGIALPFLTRQKIAEVNKMLVNANIDVYNLSILKSDLETFFMETISQS